MGNLPVPVGCTPDGIVEETDSRPRSPIEASSSVVQTVSRPSRDGDDGPFRDLDQYSDVYRDHVLEAPDVCSNCFGITLVERSERVPPNDRVSLELSRFTRHPRNTTTEYAPSPTSAGSKAVFCECGVEGSSDRIWSPEDVDKNQFTDFIVNLVRALREKGVAFDRRALTMYSLLEYDTTEDVDQALSAGLQKANVVATTKGDETAEQARCGADGNGTGAN
ncbi:hypothetical protein [Natronococcus roseus]|uniref:hypothetical protein n=1 Tax=Natronococcus roseus TaxID=1052014 RepID=UPI00374DB0E6